MNQFNVSRILIYCQVHKPLITIQDIYNFTILYNFICLPSFNHTVKRTSMWSCSIFLERFKDKFCLYLTRQWQSSDCYPRLVTSLQLKKSCSELALNCKSSIPVRESVYTYTTDICTEVRTCLTVEHYRRLPI